MLMEALGDAVGQLELPLLDRELAIFAPEVSLKHLAKRGMRGELLFAVPCVLSQNPQLLGYYRLLLGHSKKLFYTPSTGLTAFKRMEEAGVISEGAVGRLGELCSRVNEMLARLMDGIGEAHVSREHLDDLTLLTLGPQLRGGENVKRGITATLTVFDIILNIVRAHATVLESNRIELRNASGRNVLIHFASDPDIVIREEMVGGEIRDIVAIEVKGGTDFSNIHNRIGEAEKSHQKARQSGFVECWTVVNVSNFNLQMAHSESPSTNRFYQLEAIGRNEGQAYEDFRSRIISFTGIQG